MNAPMFTDTMNYKRLARLLRKEGYTELPGEAIILETAQKGGISLAQWVLDTRQKDSNFLNLLTMKFLHGKK